MKTGYAFLISAAILSAILGLIILLVAVLLLGIDETNQAGVVSTKMATRTVAICLILLGIAFVTAAIASIRRSPVSWHIGLVTAVGFMVIGFVSNAVLFEAARIEHTGVNIVIAGVLLWLLRKGRPAVGSTAA